METGNDDPTPKEEMALEKRCAEAEDRAGYTYHSGNAPALLFDIVLAFTTLGARRSREVWVQSDRGSPREGVFSSGCHVWVLGAIGALSMPVVGREKESKTNETR